MRWRILSVSVSRDVEVAGGQTSLLEPRLVHSDVVTHEGYVPTKWVEGTGNVPLAIGEVVANVDHHADYDGTFLGRGASAQAWIPSDATEEVVKETFAKLRAAIAAALRSEAAMWVALSLDALTLPAPDRPSC